MAGIDPTLLAAATSVVETLVNKALALDPAASKQLGELADTTIKIEVNSPLPGASALPTAIYGILQEDRVMIASSAESADVTISGSPVALFRLMIETDKQALVRNQAIQITGNAEKAEKFQSILASLDIDWESELAKHIGDIPAHFIGQRIRGNNKWRKEANNSLLLDIEEYIKEESGLIPPKVELQTHFSAVDDIRLATERLEARIHRLQSKLNSDA